MGSNVKELYGKTVFADANAMIYYLEGLSNEISTQVIESASREIARIKLLTTTRVIDEVLFKIILIRGKARYGLEAKVIDRLKRDTAKVRSLAGDVRKVMQFLDCLNVTITQVSLKDLYAIPEIMMEWGIFGNDALILKTMRRFNLKYLLSSDRDFDHITWIKRIDPL